MYTDFFNLTDRPFDLTASPRFLYLGDVHREALAFLSYGVLERKGFILLTGEVGTGKTTMVRSLLDSLNENVECVYLSNPQLSTQDFIDYLASSVFKRKMHFTSKAEFLIAFEEFLRKCLEDRKAFVLIVDDAQRLSFDLLEEIRLLSNMETTEDKLINIFFVGQPELNERLAEPKSRPLRQRLSIRYHLDPLDLKGTREYLKRRLKVAGAVDESEIFSRRVMKDIHQYSKGYPRVINVLADNVLLLAYSRGQRTITPDMVKESYRNMGLVLEKPKTDPPAKPAPLPRWGKWAGAFASVLVIGFVVGVIMGYAQNRVAGDPETEIGVSTVLSDRPVVASTVKPEEETLWEEVVVEEIGMPEEEDEIVLAVGPSEVQEEPADPVRPDPLREAKMVSVKPEDTLSKLSLRIYGRWDEAVTQSLKHHNREITDIDRILVGQEIAFPPLDVPE